MTAERYFKLGCWPMILAGGAHLVGAVIDAVAPTLFAPDAQTTRAAMKASAIALTDRVSVWSAWLGFNISHGLGVCVTGLLLLVLATTRFQVVREVPVFVILAIAVSGVLLATSLRFWFFAPSLAMAVSFGAFAMAAVKLRTERQGRGA